MKRHVTVQSFFKRAAILMLGPVIWALHFGAIYAVAGFGPAFNLSALDIRIICWVLTVIACTALLLVLWIKRTARKRPPYVDDFASGYFIETLCLLSLAGILLEALALWIIPLQRGV